MKVENLVPEVYYKESRDFSYIGRLFEVLLNYMKTNADLVDASLDSENIKSLSLDLLSSTLGFESKHNYIIKDLIYIASSFSSLLRKKGTSEAIEEAIQILLTSQNLQETPFIDINVNTFEIQIIIPVEMTDIILLEDLFDYILPAGWVVTINQGRKQDTELPTSATSKDTISAYIINDAGDLNGLGNVYNQPQNEIDEPEYEFEFVSS